ncbi:MAG: hypothetical protein RL217_869 [Pseudomonadota bacterium]|jgi:hypothetical protein
MKGLKNTLLSDAFWIRTLFLVVFYLVFRLLDIVLLLVTLGQWFYQIITGEKHLILAEFGASLGEYAKQIADFLSGASDEKPYPFQDWPKKSRN